MHPPPHTRPRAIPPRPSVPPPYIAGLVRLPINKPVSLLELIHEQINRDCPGTSVEFMIWPNPTNQAPIYIGSHMAHRYDPDYGDSEMPGKLDFEHFAYYLTPMSPPRIYRSSYPGTSTAIGVIQVFSQAPNSKLHVEVME